MALCQIQLWLFCYSDKSTPTYTFFFKCMAIKSTNAQLECCFISCVIAVTVAYSVECAACVFK